MTLNELRKRLEQGDTKLYQKTIKRLIKQISRRYLNMSFEDLIEYLRSFDAKTNAGSISSEKMIAAEKRPIGQKASSTERPTVGAIRANGLLHLLN
jgi:hypothetical protein